MAVVIPAVRLLSDALPKKPEVQLGLSLWAREMAAPVMYLVRRTEG